MTPSNAPPNTPLQSGGAATRDPKGFLRTIGRQAVAAAPPQNLPILEAALCAALLDPVNRNPSDSFEEAMSHFDGVARDLNDALSSEVSRAPLPVEKCVSALNSVILQISGYGGDAQTYDDLANANLFRVIERRRGLPVALGLIYMHVGRAAGIQVSGLSFPGHFLIQVQSGAERAIVDPFLGGITQDAAGLRALLKSSHGDKAELSSDHYQIASDRSILLRLQNNLKIRLLHQEQHHNASEILEIMLMMAPDAAELWREAGVLHATLGNLRAALTALNNFLDVEPRNGQRAQVEALIQELTRKMN